MKILITGITGLIGKHLAYKLVEVGGYKIKGQYFSSKDLSYFTENSIDLIQADINNKASLKDICADCNIVVHTAARVLDFGKKEDFYQTHYYATQYLLEDAKQHQVKHFIYLSSIGVVSGINRKKEIPTEATPLVKTGVFYDDVKIDTEQLVKDFCTSNQIAYTIIRPSAVVGPGSVWVKEPLDRILHKGFFPLIDNGKNSACLIDARNLAEGIYSTITNPIARNNCYFFIDDFTDITWKTYFTDLLNMIGKKPSISLPYAVLYPIAVVLEKFANLTNKKPILAKKSLNALGTNRIASAQKAKEELGFYSKYNYKDTISYINKWVVEKYL